MCVHTHACLQMHAHICTQTLTSKPNPCEAQTIPRSYGPQDVEERWTLVASLNKQGEGPIHEVCGQGADGMF